MKVVLAIAGSDPSGGAGIQADLRVYAAHGILGTTAITAVTVQDSTRLVAVNPVDPEVVAAQIAAVRADCRVDAVKIGLLPTAAIARTVAAALRGWEVPIILDTPLRATAGGQLADPEVVAVLRDELLPLALLATPNAAEARQLAGDAAPEAWAAGAPCAVLITGGDGVGELVRDVFIEGDLVQEHAGPRVPGGPFRGTGCALSSAIAALVARGEPLEAAVETAIAWTRARIVRAARPGRGAWVLVELRKKVL